MTSWPLTSTVGDGESPTRSITDVLSLSSPRQSWSRTRAFSTSGQPSWLSNSTRTPGVARGVPGSVDMWPVCGTDGDTGRGQGGGHRCQAKGVEPCEAVEHVAGVVGVEVAVAQR